MKYVIEWTSRGGWNTKRFSALLVAEGLRLRYIPLLRMDQQFVASL